VVAPEGPSARRYRLREVSAQHLSFRPATTSDAERLGRAVVEGIEDYRSFAPQGWTPPALSAEVETLRGRLGDEQVWCLLAETGDGELAGQITVLPAARAVHPVDDPALAHLANLFVRRDLWGTGLAGALHAAAVDTARGRGFSAIRLFSAAGQRRARRFYEREGWLPAGEEFYDAALGLAVIEYRYALGVR
jgi:GNAT superfamily N-acetyltransferase